MSFQIILLISLVLSTVYGINQTNHECDQLGILFYEDIGCTPQYLSFRECPAKYICDLKSQPETCKFRGRNIPVGTELHRNENLPPCKLHCRCKNKNKFECVIVDCPLEEEKIEEGCYLKNKLGVCCPREKICSKKGNKPAKCVVNDNETYLEGEIFYPKDTCLECVCSKGYNGKNEAPFCRRKTCGVQINHNDVLQENCAPFYRHGNTPCCPHGYICPSLNDSPISFEQGSRGPKDLKCKFGKQIIAFGSGVRTTTKIYGRQMQAICRCDTPPLLTCKEEKITT